MKKLLPSIFNDVLGPVMRGPSSSHTAGSFRIGSLLRDLVGPGLSAAAFEFHPEGSLASTYHTQGSDIGLATGLAGMDILDPRMQHSLRIASEMGIDVTFTVASYPADHPNTYKCTLRNSSGETFTATALSTGGGMIRMISLMGFPVNFLGDETVLFGVVGQSADCLTRKQFVDTVSTIDGFAGFDWVVNGADHAALFRFSKRPDLEGYAALFESEFRFYRVLNPVMPIPGQGESTLPFNEFEDVWKDEALLNLPASELARRFESARSGFSVGQLDKMMESLVEIWTSSIHAGLAGTQYADRLIGSQSPAFMDNFKKGNLIEAGPLNRMIAYSTSLMEVKSSMGVVIAAPTAGACGGLPGCLIGYADHIKDTDKLVDGFWAAGLAGLFIAIDATFAAEVAGCQAETGAGAAMAAAGLIEMCGGSARQAFDAASLAMQNVIGLVCDPIANRVEIPCLSRNANGAGNALTSANMILGGIKAVVPFNEAIITMMKVGQSMPASLRCTALGGLSDTPTARRMEADINDIDYIVRSKN
jgi:L-serine dehydratase